jgi:hypothetical protein
VSGGSARDHRALDPGNDRGPEGRTSGPSDRQRNYTTPRVRRIGPPCGCPLDHHECRTHRGNIAASRAAWEHFRFLGLLDSEGHMEGVLRDLGRSA